MSRRIGCALAVLALCACRPNGSVQEPAGAERAVRAPSPHEARDPLDTDGGSGLCSR